MMTKEKYTALVSGELDWDDLTDAEVFELEERVDAAVALRVLDGWTTVIPTTIQ